MKRTIAALLLVAAIARAGECPVPAGAAPALASVDGEARLRYLQRGMRFAARRARIWAWSSAGVLLAAGNFNVMAAFYVPGRGDRIDLWVGAASIGFSLLAMAAVPPLVTIDQWTLDRHIKRAGPDGDRCALLAEAERFLVRDARSEERGTGLGMHVATLLFNLGTGALLGIAFNRWNSAASNIFIGAGLGELQIWTQPTLSVTLLDRYRAGNLTPLAGKKPIAWNLVPTARRDAFGLSLALSF